MFFSGISNRKFFQNRSDLLKIIDEDNLDRKKKFYLKMKSRKLDARLWMDFKKWILWRWVNKNFSISEHFCNRLVKNAKKLEIEFSIKEEKFIHDINELQFTTWRPLKEIKVIFKLEKKELINFQQLNSNIYEYNLETKKVNFIEKGNFYFSNKKMYLTDDDQSVMMIFNYVNIKEVKIIATGVLIITHDKNYLIRSTNRYLSYVILQRMLPNLQLDISGVKNLYDYLDFWNQIVSKLN